MIRLSRKFIKRSIVGLALLAPIVYLFGSQFFALAGAHGTQVFADEGTTTDVTYYDFEREFGLWYQGSSPQSYANAFSTSILFPYPANSTIVVSISAPELDANAQAVFSFYNDGVYVGSSSRFDNTAEFSSSLIAGSNSFRVSFYGFSINASTYLSYPVTISTSLSTAVDYYSAVGFTKYVFGNMFGKSNFLTEWGSDAVSDTPHGFVPFGVLLKTIDENVLHLSDVQIGLMSYGYFYYCAHVLIFAFVFECATFFISWCSSIFNKFGGKDNGD